MHIKKNKCIKFKGYDRDTTSRPLVLGLQSDVTKLNGLYTCVTMPISEQCSALIITR